MKKWKWAILWVVVGIVLPSVSHAQGVASSIKSMQTVLDQLYDEMIPMCGNLVNVGRGIAGFAALWYIASRVWRHIANAEPVDFYPLFRPFALGLCIANFPMVIAMINGVMKPTVTGTAMMVQDSNKAIAVLLKQKEDALKKTTAYQMYVGELGSGDKDKWLKYTQGLKDSDPTPDEGMFASIGSDIQFAMAKASYNFSNSVKQWMSEVLNVLYEAAALCINTLRTFQLIVLAILGPLVFGVAVFDGFQHTLSAWLAKYINIYLWLPVANIFGAIICKIQENMLKLDLSQIQGQGDTVFSPTDIGYLIFLIIGIVGYVTVPSVAGFIVNSGGMSAMGQKVTNILSSAGGGMTSRAGAAAGAVYNAPGHYNAGLSGAQDGKGTSGSIGRTIGGAGAYMADKLSGGKKDKS